MLLLHLEQTGEREIVLWLAESAVGMPTNTAGGSNTFQELMALASAFATSQSVALGAATAGAASAGGAGGAGGASTGAGAATAAGGAVPSLRLST